MGQDMARFDEFDDEQPEDWAEDEETRRGTLETVRSLLREIPGASMRRKLAAPVITLALVGIVLGLTGTLGGGGNGSDEPVSPGDSYELGSLAATSSWVNFYGLQCTLDGHALPVGAVITARDPQGVVCGEFLVSKEGCYGLMPVYADDPATDADEGARPGDLIELRVNGINAVLAGPDEAVWAQMGDLRQVDLEAHSSS